MRGHIIDRLNHFMCFFLMGFGAAACAVGLWVLCASLWITICAELLVILLLAFCSVWWYEKRTTIHRFMEEYQVFRLLHERAFLQTADSDNQIFDIGLQHDAFAVLLVQGLEPRQDETISKRMAGAPSNIVQIHLMQSLGDRYHLRFTRIEQADVAIVAISELGSASSSQSVQDTLADLVQQLALARQRLMETGYPTRIAISEIHFDLREAGTVYQEILEMIEYADFCGTADAILTSFEQIYQGDTSVALERAAKLERNFFVAATNYQFQQAAEYMRELLESYTRHRFESVPAIKARFYGRLETVCNLIGTRINVGDMQYFPQVESNPYDRFMSLRTKEQLVAEIQNFFSSMEEAYFRASASTGDIVADAAAYIDCNYADVNLTVSFLADQLYVNSSYLSRVFRQKRDCGVLEYINQRRINEACRLLRTTKLEFQQIAALVGFESAKAMGRVFKKYVGITPTAYREAKGGVLNT